MKNPKAYIIAAIGFILLQAGVANANDEFGTYVAKAVFFKWSPKTADIKEINADYYENDQYQDDETDQREYAQED
jgi:hypothetical protein